MADFGAKAHIDSVSITPRTGCCVGRLHDFDIRIGDINNEKANNFCKKNANIADEQTANFKCNQQQVGRYLYIVTHVVNQKLTLCEVEAYGFYV